MTFIPSTPSESVKVPCYEDAKASDGWQGQTTTKSVKVLQSEISAAIGRLNGNVSSFQEGTFEIGKDKRRGFRIHYMVSTPSGSPIPGRIDIAALPIKISWRQKRTEKTRQEKSLRMALYMARIAFEVSWFLMKLSPGYAPMIPFMLANQDKTVSQMWSDSPAMKMLAPPSDAEFVEAVVISKK